MTKATLATWLLRTPTKQVKERDFTNGRGLKHNVHRKYPNDTQGQYRKRIANGPRHYCVHQTFLMQSSVNGCAKFCILILQRTCQELAWPVFSKLICERAILSILPGAMLYFSVLWMLKYDDNLQLGDQLGQQEQARSSCLSGLGTDTQFHHVCKGTKRSWTYFILRSNHLTWALG